MPASQHPSNKDQAVLILGMRRGTKIGRRQFVTTADPVAKRMVAAFWSSTPPGAPLSQTTTYGRYAALLKRAWRHARVDHLNFTAHSPRAGWATEQRLLGAYFSEIKAQGRWASDRSLLTYLDLSTTLLLQLQLNALGPSGDWILEDVAGRYPWWTG